MPRVRAGDLLVAYDDEGAEASPPVVWLHGGLGSRMLWALQVRALRDRFRCLVPDLRGHGGTVGGDDVEAFTAAVLADDLLAFADALGLERFALVGLSMGGFAAQAFAAAHPDRIDRLVLADTWMVTAPEGPIATWTRALSPVVEGALRVAGTGPLAALAARALGDDAEEAGALARAATLATSRETAVRVWRGVATHDTREAAARIAVPTLVVAGERDVNLGQARRLADLVPGARLEVLAGVGHNTNLAAPAEFTRAVEGFLVG